MNDNFSPRVKRIFTYSKDEAIRLGQSTVGTEHFILAMLQEGEGRAIEILQNLGVDIEKLRQQIHTLTSVRGLSPANYNSIHFTIQAERAMQTTYLEAKRTQNDVINTAHLLLSILRNENDPTTKIFNKIGVNYDLVRNNLQSSQHEGGYLVNSVEEFDSYERDYRLPQNDRINRVNNDKMPKRMMLMDNVSVS